MLQVALLAYIRAHEGLGFGQSLFNVYHLLTPAGRHGHDYHTQDNHPRQYFAFHPTLLVGVPIWKI
jgi:hypothetical protein